METVSAFLELHERPLVHPLIWKLRARLGAGSKAFAILWGTFNLASPETVGKGAGAKI